MGLQQRQGGYIVTARKIRNTELKHWIPDHLCYLTVSAVSGMDLACAEWHNWDIIFYLWSIHGMIPPTDNGDKALVARVLSSPAVFEYHYRMLGTVNPILVRLPLLMLCCVNAILLSCTRPNSLCQTLWTEERTETKIIIIWRSDTCHLWPKRLCQVLCSILLPVGHKKINTFQKFIS